MKKELFPVKIFGKKILEFYFWGWIIKCWFIFIPSLFQVFFFHVARNNNFILDQDICINEKMCDLIRPRQRKSDFF